MPELTAEVVRTIIEDVMEDKISGLKQDVGSLKHDVSELKQDVGGLRQDVTGLKQEVGGLQQEIGGVHRELGGLHKEIGGLQQEIGGLHRGVGDLGQEMERGFRQVHKEIEITRQDTLDAIERVLATVQSMHDEDQEEIAGINGRLRSHNERIAKLERLNNLR